MGLLLFFICYTRRKSAIGGWYLYFLIQLFLGIAILIPMSLLGLSNYNPLNHQSFGYYILYLISTVPSDLFMIGQVIIAIKLILISGRDWKYVKLLIFVLLGDLLFSIIALTIDAFFWPDYLAFDVLALIWPCIWLPYFIKSTRIKAVYKTKTWGLE